MKNASLLKIGIDFKCHHTDCTSSLTAYSEAALENVQAEKYHSGKQRARTFRVEAAERK